MSTPQARRKQQHSDFFQAQKQTYGIIVVYLKTSAVMTQTQSNEDNGEGMWSDVDASPVILSNRVKEKSNPP